MAAFVISGPGAVGMALGAELLRAGHSVRYFGRSGPVSVSAEVVFPSMDSKVPGDSVVVSVPVWDHSFTADAVFFCVKAYQLAPALSFASKTLASAPPFVVLCNGVVDGVLREFVEGENRSGSSSPCFRLGVGTVGVTQIESKFVVRSLTGGWVWGPISFKESKFQSSSIHEKPFSWERELFLGERFSWTDSPLEMVREKWLVNTTVNTIAAAYRMPANGEILKKMAVFEQVFKEAVQLGRDLWGAWSKSDEELKENLLKVIQDTVGNENSMARDVRMKRPTESSWLAGLAVGRTGFPSLVSLHQKIESY